MNDVSKLTVAVIDYGLFECCAQALARGYKEVLYYVPWRGSYPTTDKANIGVGVPGLTRVYDWNDAVERADEVAIFDVGFDSERKMAVKLGKPVFGGCGSKLEWDRIFFKKCLESVGLPYSPYEVAVGIDALVKRLQEVQDKWIKVSTFRGILETFHHKDYKYSKPKIDNAAEKLGGWRDQMPFIIEDPVFPKDKGVEGGGDFFQLHGDFLPIGTYGYEVKDTVYLCKFLRMDEWPGPIKKINDRLLPIYKQFDISGMASSEVRKGMQGDGVFIDYCGRAGSPPAEIICEGYKNFPQIVHAIANGRSITPAPIAKYAAMILIKSEMAIEDWVPMELKEQNFNRIKIRNLCNVKGQYYYIPQDKATIIGAALGFGNTYQEARDESLQVAKGFECEESWHDANGWDEQEENLKKAQRFGLGTF